MHPHNIRIHTKESACVCMRERKKQMATRNKILEKTHKHTHNIYTKTSTAQYRGSKKRTNLAHKSAIATTTNMHNNDIRRMYDARTQCVCVRERAGQR